MWNVGEEKYGEYRQALEHVRVESSINKYGLSIACALHEGLLVIEGRQTNSHE